MSFRKPRLAQCKEIFGKIATYIDSLDANDATKKAKKDIISGILYGVQINFGVDNIVHELEKVIRSKTEKGFKRTTPKGGLDFDKFIEE